MSTYLVTGIARGIGLEFAKQITANPKNTLIGVVRKSSNLDKLNALKIKNLKLLYLDMNAPLEEFEKVFSELDALAPSGIDYIIHNSGVTADSSLLALEDNLVSDFEKCFNTNTIGTFKFYKAISPKLKNNGKPYKMTFVSSAAALMNVFIAGTGCYGVSKAGINHMMVQINFEQRKANTENYCISVHPGLVDTDILDIGSFDKTLYAEYFTPIDVAVAGVLKSTHEMSAETSGKMYDHNGEVFPF